MADKQQQTGNLDALIEDDSPNASPNKIERVNHTPPPAKTAEMVYNETYSEAEQHDVNNIGVTIPDNETPIVILFGAPSMGKTMALLRLIRFFNEKYGTNAQSVVPEYVFRPESDIHYSAMCDRLNALAYRDYAPGPTDIISFMLVKIYNNGVPVCQILEAPGEHYFDGSPEPHFPTYIHEIMGTPNKKIWVFFVEKGWGKNQNERDCYKKAIHGIGIKDGDDVVFLFNKADKFRNQLHDDVVHFEREIEQQYRGIFDPFRRTNRLEILMFGRDKYKKVCFSSGTFTRTQQPDPDKAERWIPGTDNRYCENFWNALDLPNK